MNRRIRFSSGHQGHQSRAATRAPLLGLALGLAACSSDLFHDTKWQSRCDAEPDAAICPQGTGGASATSTTSSTSDASSTSSASAVSSSGSSGGSSATSTTGAGGAASTSTGASMMASTSTGP